MVLSSPQFDWALIRFLRRCVFNFLKLNENFVINDIPLKTVILEDANSMEEYRNKIVLQDGEDARNLILVVLPLVLRIGINIVELDLKDKRNDNFTQLYEATAPKYYFSLKDSLNLHQDSISILLKPGHYDGIYKKIYIDKKHNFLLNLNLNLQDLNVWNLQIKHI